MFSIYDKCVDDNRLMGWSFKRHDAAPLSPCPNLCLCTLSTFRYERFSISKISVVFLYQRKELFLLQMLLTSTPELKKLDSEVIDLEKEIRSTFEVSRPSQSSTHNNHTLQTFIHEMYFCSAV